MKTAIKLSGIVLLTFFTLSTTKVSAQDYKALKTDASYYFYDSVAMDIIPIRIDSVTSIGTETQYFGMRQIRQTDYGCFTPDGASWLGDMVTENQAGVFQFILYPFSPPDSADVFTIHSKSLPGYSWHFYNYHTSNEYIEATVSQISLASFIGLTDSVKTITLQRKDVSGQNVNDPVNGQKILLSQNYGLIRLPKFDEFNSNLRFFDLCGKTNPITGRTNLTFEEIFDFQPGDEMHIVYEDEPYATFYPKESGYLIQRILGRINGSNSDTVTYTISECKSTTYVQGMNQTTTINATDTIQVKYIKSYNPDFAYEPKEPQISDYPGMPELTDDEMGMSATYELEHPGIPWKLSNAIWPLWLDGSGQCWSYATIDDYEKSAHYYKGLGGPYHYWMAAWMNTNYRKLVYYKKGAETWGTPLDCETLLHVGTPEYQQNQNINIYPNPTLGNITVSTPEGLIFSCRFKLFDISGRPVKEMIMTQQKQSFDISDLPCGLYSYKLTTDTGEVFHGKIIRQ